MQIVIPMAGQGKRFDAARYTVIKPLINVHGKPIIEYVINLFPGEKDFIFICNTEHLKTTPLEKILKKIKPSGKIVAVASHTLGPVETILQGKNSINSSDSVIINYCDFFMYWDYAGFKKKIKKEKADGALVCYKGFHPHLLGSDLYAGVKTDENNIFLETREKYSYTPNKMDSWQSTGTYYFQNGSQAIKYLTNIKEKELLTNGEYYIPWAYNLMQEDNLKSIVYPTKYFCQWGTPRDLEEYLYWSEYFLSSTN